MRRCLRSPRVHLWVAALCGAVVITDAALEKQGQSFLSPRLFSVLLAVGIACAVVGFLGRRMDDVFALGQQVQQSLEDVTGENRPVDLRSRRRIRRGRGRSSA